MQRDPLTRLDRLRPAVAGHGLERPGRSGGGGGHVATLRIASRDDGSVRRVRRPGLCIVVAEVPLWGDDDTLDGNRHLERRVALWRQRRGVDRGDRTGSARLFGVLDPRRRRRRLRSARQPARRDVDGDDRHRHPERVDAHARRDRCPARVAVGRTRRTLPVRHRHQPPAVHRHGQLAGHLQEPGRDDGRVPRRARRRGRTPGQGRPGAGGARTEDARTRPGRVRPVPTRTSSPPN